MRTYEETENLLLSTIALSDNTVEQIAEASGIKASTLFKWKSKVSVHLLSQKSDALLNYFIA